MSRFDVQILPDAEAEIAAAFLWYFERSPQAAVAFRDEALSFIDDLTESAAKWREDDDGTRRRLLRHFPYTIFFEIERKTVFVLAVAHNRRAPGYWFGR